MECNYLVILIDTFWSCTLSIDSLVKFFLRHFLNKLFLTRYHLSCLFLFVEIHPSLSNLDRARRFKILVTRGHQLEEKISFSYWKYSFLISVRFFVYSFFKTLNEWKIEECNAKKLTILKKSSENQIELYFLSLKLHQNYYSTLHTFLNSLLSFPL